MTCGLQERFFGLVFVKNFTIYVNSLSKGKSESSKCLFLVFPTKLFGHLHYGLELFSC